MHCFVVLLYPPVKNMDDRARYMYSVFVFGVLLYHHNIDEQGRTSSAFVLYGVLLYIASY